MQSIGSRKGSCKTLTFGMPHVFKALQLLHRDRFVSRSTFCRQLHIGEGAVKTLISHMKAQRIAGSARAGTYLTQKGEKFARTMTGAIADERVIQKPVAALGGRCSHAILVKNHAAAVRTGLEQRDFAILYGAPIALTLICRSGRLCFPGEEKGALAGDAETLGELMSMNPEENDVVIITSADDPFVAEVAAKNSALCTVASG